MALDPSAILHALGHAPDRWQRDVLLSRQRQLLLNCSRQAGKSTVAAALALHTALFEPRQLVLLLSPGLRQSTEIFRKLIDAYDAVDRPVPAESRTALGLELTNGSRIVCLPGNETTIRGYTPQLLVIDEASRVPDDLYRSVRPMLAVSQGRLLALSTRSAGAAGSTTNGKATAPGSASRCPGGSVRASVPISSKKNAGPSATIECGKNTSAPSRRSRGSSTRAWAMKSQRCQCLRSRLSPLVWVASIGVGAIRSRRCGACWTKATYCGSTTSVI